MPPTSDAERFGLEEVMAFREMIGASKELRKEEARLAVHSVRDLQVESGDVSIPIRIYSPAGEGPFPVVHYFHGAGWVAGNLDTHDNICRYFSAKLNSVVVAVDYRLAPEYKWPAGFDDCFQSFAWVMDHADDFNIGPSRCAVSGESAAGHLAAAVALKARNEGFPKIAFQLLAYAIVDGTSPSGRNFKQHLFDESGDAATDYASPALANYLTGLPPALIIYGEEEEARAENERYIQRLKDHGIPVESLMVEGQGHAVFPWVSASGNQHVLDKAVEALNRVFD